MNVSILMGSPRLHGNTAELCKPFAEELKANGADVCYVTLADKNINPCKRIRQYIGFFHGIVIWKYLLPEYTKAF